MDKQIGKLLREMQQKAKLSRASGAAVVGSRQPAVARFESCEAHVMQAVMVQYADYFDVFLDYIFGRTDSLQVRTRQKSKTTILKWKNSSRYVLIPVLP